MKVVFLTNQASYHQMHYARAMVSLLGEADFRIVFQNPTSEARAEMGWGDNYSEAYIIRFWQSDNAKRDAVSWIESADVVIQGRFPIKYVRHRIRSGKLTFACQERLWKKPPSWKRMFSRLPHLIKNYYSVNRANYHLLAIGAYAAKDLNDLGLFKHRSWRYGYFMDSPDQLKRTRSGDALKLVWCARFSAVKQPEVAIRFLTALHEKGVAAQLTMIGDGELKSQILEQVNALGLTDHVRLTGWQTQESVTNAMLDSDVFLMTSHHGEGWGMVLNESMTYGCVPVANQDLGAAKWLIKDGDNGYLFKDDCVDSVVDRLSQLSIDELQSMGLRAAGSMQAEWSAAAAAKQSLVLFEMLLSGRNEEATTLSPNGLLSFVDTNTC